MEESRAISRVTINDPVFDEIQNQRYQKHRKSLERLRSEEKKSNSLYTTYNSRTRALDIARKAKIQSFTKVFPPDSEYQNCMKRIQQIKQSTTKLPKISNTKLVGNKLLREYRQAQIEKENQAIKNKLSHISLEKKKEGSSLYRSIHEYEIYRKISRRSKEPEKNLVIHKN